MIAVHYFASIREALGRDLDKLELPTGVTTVAGLIDHLAGENGDKWRDVLAGNSVMVAVNHEMSDRSTTIANGDEVAFFPPVTGG